MSAFSGLMSSACALASAAAIAPMVSLDRYMTEILFEKVETDRARFRPLGANAVAQGFLRVLRHQGLELGLGALMVEKGRAGRAEERCELGPGVGFAHVDDANRLDPQPRRLEAIWARDFAGLNAAPESALGGDQSAVTRKCW